MEQALRHVVLLPIHVRAVPAVPMTVVQEQARLVLLSGLHPAVADVLRLHIIEEVQPSLPAVLMVHHLPAVVIHLVVAAVAAHGQVSDLTVVVPVQVAVAAVAVPVQVAAVVAVPAVVVEADEDKNEILT